MRNVIEPGKRLHPSWCGLGVVIAGLLGIAAPASLSAQVIIGGKEPPAVEVNSSALDALGPPRLFGLGSAPSDQLQRPSGDTHLRFTPFKPPPPKTAVMQYRGGGGISKPVKKQDAPPTVPAPSEEEAAAAVVAAMEAAPPPPPPAIPVGTPLAGTPLPPPPVPVPVKSAAVTAPHLESALTLAFREGSSDLLEKTRTDLVTLAQRLETNPASTVQLLGYAGGGNENISKARRLSLARVLEVRQFLLDKGVDSKRVEVRALGNKLETGKEMQDRVEVVLGAP